MMEEDKIRSVERSNFYWRDYLPKEERPIQDCDDITLLTMCIWGEARGEALPEKIWVGCTVRNRVRNPRWWGKNWREVILKPYQYSAFNQGDPNEEKMRDPLKWDKEGRAWRQCIWVTWGIYHDLEEDVTGGATHYHQSSMRKYPSWAEALARTAEMGSFLFYNALPGISNRER
jgi:spore germination cell wall hydrolase CwlJ-like protein